MNLERFAGWLTLVANLGVVGGLGFRFGRVWWNELKTNFPSDLAAEIDAQLEANPDLLLRQFQGIRKASRELSAP